MTPETINIPMFARLHDSKIIDLTSFVVRLPTTRASADPTVAAEA
jgi:hypothetical protein